MNVHIYRWLCWPQIHYENHFIGHFLRRKKYLCLDKLARLRWQCSNCYHSHRMAIAASNLCYTRRGSNIIGVHFYPRAWRIGQYFDRVVSWLLSFWGCVSAQLANTIDKAIACRIFIPRRIFSVLLLAPDFPLGLCRRSALANHGNLFFTSHGERD